MLAQLLNNNIPLKLRFRRFEFKYCLPEFLAPKIASDLIDYMDYDPYIKNQKDKFYQVSSLYFDTADFNCYYEKLAGVKDRKKLRIRTYATEIKPDTPVFLEIKRRNDAVITKDRLVSDYKRCFDFINYNQIEELKKQLLSTERESFNEFFWLKNHNCLLPKIMVIYKRCPFVSKIDPGFRITFDTEIKSYPANDLFLKYEASRVFSGGAIIEVKYNNTIPAWFHQIVTKYQLNRQSFSKYARSLETCRKEYKYV